MTFQTALFTDLYELTMLQAYHQEGMQQEAVFDLYVRHLPQNRNLLVACGLEQCLEYLEQIRFSEDSLDYLRSLHLFSSEFLDYLSSFRFTGQVRAVPEGTVVFPGEPLLEVSGPIAEAQLAETYLLNQMTFQTAIASKGIRMVLAAEGRSLVDFGSRRAHGSDAALKAARALYVSGFDSTSNVLAGHLFGIPVSGTMAHSYIQAHDSEREALESFLRTFPETVVLVDTYDTAAGVRRAAEAANSVPGARLRGVRLDSGDLAELSKQARSILDKAGLVDVQVVASGGLDEAEIAALLKAGALIDAFGVGTAAVVSDDAPTLDSAYKLVSYAGKPRMKLSTGKDTLPGRKQVFRRYINGQMVEDVIGLADEEQEGEPLLRDVMVNGSRTDAGSESIDQARERVIRQLRELPSRLRTLERAERPYSPTITSALKKTLHEVRDEITREAEAGD